MEEDPLFFTSGKIGRQETLKEDLFSIFIRVNSHNSSSLRFTLSSRDTESLCTRLRPSNSTPSTDRLSRIAVCRAFSLGMTREEELKPPAGWPNRLRKTGIRKLRGYSLSVPSNLFL